MYWNGGDAKVTFPLSVCLERFADVTFIHCPVSKKRLYFLPCGSYYEILNNVFIRTVAGCIHVKERICI